MSGRIEISCKRVGEKAKSFTIVDGTTEEVTDRRTGEITQRPKMFCLPKSCASYDPDTCKASMPEWLALDRGLI